MTRLGLAKPSVCFCDVEPSALEAGQDELLHGFHHGVKKESLL